MENDNNLVEYYEAEQESRMELNKGINKVL